MSAGRKKYRSKIGLAIVLPLAIGLISAEILLLLNHLWRGAIFIILAALFITYLYFDTFYTIINDGKLLIKGGFFVKREINIKSIKTLKATNNPMSAPAFSLDRLEVCFNKYDTILISRENKNSFIEQLKEANSNMLLFNRPIII